MPLRKTAIAVPEEGSVLPNSYSYRRGEASFVEFLDAQRAYNDTIQSYNEARADFARSLYLIDSISGKGVNP